jgi:uncharacterized protein YndB with AHSA1/START domain
MQPYEASMSAVIKAPAGQVYAILADYRQGHPQILPKQYFTKLEVLEGGIGAGTRVRFEMSAMGRKQVFNGIVSEPEPGRVLVESNESDSGSTSVTTFTVDPMAGGAETRVTIHTQAQSPDGVGGLIERLISKLFLRRVYAQELALLAAYAEQASQKSAS